ncbi:MAG TPA: hypothetical protein VIG33_14945, partial [Pseudobdellovibrionaceae bacterium]
FLENFPVWIEPKDADIYPARPSILFDDSTRIYQIFPFFVKEPSFEETKFRLIKRISVTVKFEN